LPDLLDGKKETEQAEGFHLTYLDIHVHAGL